MPPILGLHRECGIVLHPVFRQVTRSNQAGEALGEWSGSGNGGDRHRISVATASVDKELRPISRDFRGSLQYLDWRASVRVPALISGAFSVGPVKGSVGVLVYGKDQDAMFGMADPFQSVFSNLRLDRFIPFLSFQHRVCQVRSMFGPTRIRSIERYCLTGQQGMAAAIFLVARGEIRKT
ncbi:MAG: hypothetical protein KGQ60_01530 [Planctomycetes bacterium]|nr:hypothetical protein [Planctomycetota bacterium]